MQLEFSYISMGFSEDEWDSIPRTDKAIIRDYEWNGRHVERTSIFSFYETDRSVRRAVHRYDLIQRPLTLSCGSLVPLHNSVR